MGKLGKRLLKVFGWTVLALLVLAAIGITMTVGWRPVLGPKARAVTNRKFQVTPARLERGRYLAENVMGCIECHTPAQDDVVPPVRTGPPGAGRIFLEKGNFRVVAANLTPDPETGLGKWSDDQIARAIREGIDEDGSALFPIMPYQEFRSVSDEDIASVIVYLRSLPPVRNQLPHTQVPFPVSRLINSAPAPLTAPVEPPDVTNPIKRGEYLTRAGGCIGCHTPMERGQPLPEMEFAGGQTFGEVASTNLTPDASGISYYDPQLFRDVIHSGKVKARVLKVMPWWVYRNMTEDDLNGIYAYLRTLPARRHRVDNTESPTDCKICRQKHGAGELN